MKNKKIFYTRIEDSSWLVKMSLFHKLSYSNFQGKRICGNIVDNQNKKLCVTSLKYAPKPDWWIFFFYCEKIVSLKVSMVYNQNWFNLYYIWCIKRLVMIAEDHWYELSKIWKYWRRQIFSLPAGIYLFKVNNRNTRKRCEICSKLTVKLVGFIVMTHINILKMNHWDDHVRSQG